MRLKLGLFLLLGLYDIAPAVPADHAERMTKGLGLFEKEVRGVLTENCLKCHGGDKVKGDFDLATREGLLAGGAEGVSVVAFRSAESRMLKMMRHEEEPAMPDKKPKLPDEVIAKVAEWIDLGAPYAAPLVAGKQPPRDKSKVSEEDRKWWSFQPLSAPPVPAGAGNPVDAFLIEKAREKGLTLNPPADERTLLRRASLILTGLPPEPGQSTMPVETLTEKLLASPHFGERWARHWLDVARFAESSGFEHDYDRPHAWHFRDFVIRALNADMPYDQFLHWQLAGDEFSPGNAEAMMATGFLGAGVFPTQITANEVERVRYDALDDMLSTTGSAFLGLTVGCARCHDHKFDPIPEKDYYRLLTTFTTTVRSNVDLETDAQRNAAENAKHRAEAERLAADLAAYEQGELRTQFDQWITGGAADLQQSGWRLLEGEITSSGGATFRRMPDGSLLAEGANAASDTYTFTAKNVSGVHALRVEALADASMQHKGPGRAANGNFALSRITVTLSPPGGEKPVTLRLKPGEFTHQQNAGGLSVASSLDDSPNTGWAVDGQIGRDHAAVFLNEGPPTLRGRAEMKVTLEFAVNTSHNIGRLRLSVAEEGAPPVKESALPAEVAALTGKLKSRAVLNERERAALWKWWRGRQPGVLQREQKIADHAAKEPKATEPVMVCVEGYQPIVMHSQGPPFLQETHFLKRGDTNAKNGVATQSFLQVLMRGADEKRWQWLPPAGSKSTGRRRSLAAWLTDTEHGAGALVARVAVNRIWQHHFGRGIVATPNDLGRTGDLPSHPELLEWLAAEFVRSGWSQKHIHRLILGSAAWKQSAAAGAAKLAADPDNRLFCRATPRRLEAEAARDSILAVSGALDRTLFGKGTLDENSRRRSIYFTVKRSQLVNSMVVFDSPEPLVSQGARPTTTVAPQALFLMNSPQARSWAEMLAREVMKEPDWPARIQAVSRRALSRPANDFELQRVTPFLEQQSAAHRAAGRTDAELQALTDYCQTLFGLNEFLYVP